MSAAIPGDRPVGKSVASYHIVEDNGKKGIAANTSTRRGGFGQ
jgi:hypothetical protein